MLNPQEEAKFKALKAMCRELKIPSMPELYIGLKVHDHNGILVFDDLQRGHSWTRNYYNWVLGCACEAASFGDTTFGAGNLTSKTIAGTVAGANGNSVQRSSTSHINGGGNEGSTAGNWGIILGTGVGAFSVDNFVIGTKITSGSGAGQLLYNAMVNSVVSYDAGSKTWTTVVSRIFNNNSGAAITVTETAWYFQAFVFQALAQQMFERSLLDPSVLVANGAQLTVSYTLTMDFSAID